MMNHFSLFLTHFNLTFQSSVAICLIYDSPISPKSSHWSLWQIFFQKQPKDLAYFEKYSFEIKTYVAPFKKFGYFLHLDTLVTKKVEKANLICKDCLLHQCREDAVSVKGSPTRCSLLQGLNKTTVSAKTQQVGAHISPETQ